jgi:autotransporter translocation and assembly factor TamB
MRRRIVRGALAGGVLLVALVGALAALSQTAWFHEWLRARVVARLNTALTGQIAIGRLEGNLFGTLVLHDLRVTLEGERVLAARRVEARYDLLALAAGGPLVLHDVEVTGLALRLVEDPRGWNVVRLAPPRPEPRERGRALRLERVVVRDGGLKIVRPTQAWSARDVALAGSVEVGDDTRVTVDALSFVLPARKVAVEHAAGRVTVAADGGIVADGIELATHASSLRGHARIPADRSGAYDLDVEVPRLASDEVRRLLRVDTPASDLTLALRARGPGTALGVDGNVSGGDAGTLALAGTLDTAGAPLGYDVRLTLTHVNAAALLGPARPTTDLTGSATVTGKGTTLEEVASEFALALEQSRVAGRTLDELAVTGRIAERTVAFEGHAASEAGNARASGKVELVPERYDVRLAMERFDPAVLLARPDLRSSITGSLTANGSGFRPEHARADVRVEIGASRVRDLDVRDARALVHAADGRLSIETLTLRSSAADAEVSGTLALTSGAGAPAARGAAAPTGSLRYALRARDLAPLATVAGVAPLGGTLTIDGTASGSLAALDVHATVTGSRLVRGANGVERARADVSATALGSERATATIAAQASELHALGRRFATLALDGRWAKRGVAATADVDLRVDEDARRHHQLVAAAELAPAANRVQVRTLRLDLGDTTWRNEGTPSLIQRGPRVTVEQLVLRSPHGMLRVDGEGGSAGAEDVRCTVSGLDLAALTGGGEPKLGGRLSGDAHVGGTAAALALTAHLAVEAPQVDQIRYETLRLDVQTGAAGATVGARLVQAPGRQLALDATVPLRVSLAPWRLATQGGLAGSLRAEAIDVAFLDPFVPQVSKLSGTLDADLALGGTASAPELRGPVALAAGKAYVIPLGLTYDPIELRARVAGAGVTIEQLRIASRGGTLSGGGTAEIAGGDTTVDARFELARFPLFDNEFGDGAASGWIWLSGNAAAPSVEGALETAGLVLRIPESLPGAVHPPDPTIMVVGPDAPAAAATGAPLRPTSADAPAVADESRAPALPAPSIYERAAIKIQLDVPRDAWIRRSDANIELRGWMTVWKKPAEEIHLAGEIDAVRGWYSFQGKTFTLEEGRVTFTGTGFDPLLHLVATHTAGDYTVRVVVGGTITKPSLTLESDPALEQADILSVLLFGRPANQLSRNESTGLREQALGIAGNYVASELRQSVADALGVDDLRFQGGDSGLSDAKVSLGKYVAKDVFVSLAHRFGRQSVEEVRIEYRITPHWSLETSSDTLGESGIDVFWKRRY